MTLSYQSDLSTAANKSPSGGSISTDWRSTAIYVCQMQLIGFCRLTMCIITIPINPRDGFRPTGLQIPALTVRKLACRKPFLTLPFVDVVYKKVEVPMDVPHNATNPSSQAFPDPDQEAVPNPSSRCISLRPLYSWLPLSLAPRL